MIVDQDLAAQIERAEGEFIAACTRAVGRRSGEDVFALPVAGGVATYAGPDSPFDKVAGCGFDGLPSEGELDRIEAAYADRKAPVSFEISTLADPAVFEMLTGRAYRLVSFEDVLVCAVDRVDEEPVPGIDVRRAEDDLTGWLDVAVESAQHPDLAGVPQHDTFPREALEAAERAGLDAGARAYLATVDGQPAGSGGLRVAGTIAQLTGAGTLPAYRRRGVQRELVRTRLRDARVDGCDYAVVTTQPGSGSQANMRRAGFELGYSRAVLVRLPEEAPERDERRGEVSIERFAGDRQELLWLFREAEDSESALAGYLDLGEVWVARGAGGEVLGHLQVVWRDDEAEVLNTAVAGTRRGEGIGRRLVETVLADPEVRRPGRVVVATGAADVGNLRFYQRCGFRMDRVDRDAFVPATGYPDDIHIDGILLRDKVWFSLDVTPE